MKNVHFKTKQQPHEGLVSLAIRLSGSQLTRPSEFLSAFGNKASIARMLHQSAANNQKSTLVELLSLGKYQPNPILEKISCDRKLHYLLRYHTQSVCAGCIERGYTLLVHDFYGVEACHIHDYQLLKICPSCNEEILIDRKSLALCQCGQPLVEKRKATNDSIHESYFVSHLLSHQLFEQLISYLTYRRLLKERYNVSRITKEEMDAFTRSEPHFIEITIQHINHDILSLPIRAVLAPFLQSGNTYLAQMANRYLDSYSTLKPAPSPNKDLESNFYLTTKELKSAIGCKPSSASHIVRDFFDENASDAIHSINKLKKFYKFLLIPTASDNFQHQYTISEISDITKTSAHEVIRKTVHGKFTVVEFNPALPITKAIVQSPDNLCEDLPEGYLTIELAASHLNTYAEVIRSLRDCGHILATHQKNRNNRYLFSLDRLERFNYQYILIGELADRLKIKSKRLSDQLMASGIKPVAGPQIDGTIVYVYLRTDIDDAELIAISQLEDFATSSGRRANSQPIMDHEMWATSAEACETLNLSAQQLSLFISPDLLSQGLPDRRSAIRTRYFKRDTISRTKAFIDALIPLEKFCSQHQLKPRQVLRRMNLLLNQSPWTLKECLYISPSQAETLKLHFDQYWDASTSARFLGEARHTINNWRKLGKLEPVSESDPGYIANPILYHAADITKLKNAKATALG